jgi:hypothetical protein
LRRLSLRDNGSSAKPATHRDKPPSDVEDGRQKTIQASDIARMKTLYYL